MTTMTMIEYLEGIAYAKMNNLSDGQKVLDMSADEALVAWWREYRPEVNPQACSPRDIREGRIKLERAQRLEQLARDLEELGFSKKPVVAVVDSEFTPQEWDHLFNAVTWRMVFDKGMPETIRAAYEALTDKVQKRCPR
jgi:sulfur carrier protein ThiS